MNSQHTRSLAIEARGNGFREQPEPGIRLKGKWLQAAGFQPGQRCTVRLVADGVIELTAQAKTAEPVLRFGSLLK
jgi:hypothetical protein